MSRLLIIGGGGFMGHYLRRRLQDQGGYETSATYHREKPQDEGVAWYPAEVTDPEGMAEVFRQVRPEVVVHLAAMADVTQCQQQPQQAAEVNARGTEIIARLCAQYRARLVFLSTEYVFSGEEGPYRENDTPGPTTHYGRTKWEAEQAVARHAGDWSILRTSLVYGWPPTPQRANLVTRAIEAPGSGRPFYGHTDMLRSPVYVEDVVEGALRLAQTPRSGVYHLAGPRCVSMGEFVQTVADVFGLDRDWFVLAPAPPDEGGTPRPRRLGLDSSRTAELLDMQPLDMASGLEQMRIKRRESPWQQKFW